MFSLSYSGQIIIWVIVGGLGTLVGPVIGCILLQRLTNWAGMLEGVNPTSCWASSWSPSCSSCPRASCRRFPA
jgi:ABC-type branched-subunit amino acid transport system permease subunit